MPLIYAHFEPSVGWAYPILNALRARPDWPRLQRVWEEGALSDLAFSIETRIGGLGEAELLITEYTQTLLKDLPLIDGREGTAHRFGNTPALRRSLVASTYFIAEARACHENLAKFYRASLKEFFGESVSKAAAYAAIAAFSTPDTSWAETLRGFRHDLLHDYAPWLAFNVEGTSVVATVSAILTLDWRHGTKGTGATISAKDFQDIRTGLGVALSGVREELVDRLGNASKGAS